MLLQGDVDSMSVDGASLALSHQSVTSRPSTLSANPHPGDANGSAGTITGGASAADTAAASVDAGPVPAAPAVEDANAAESLLQHLADLGLHAQQREALEQ